MKKYLQIAKNTWDEMTTYRLNFTMWRVRNVLQLLALYFLWYAILPSNRTFAGYNRSLMLTYVIGTSFISSIVLSSRSNGVGEEINEGNLSNLLLKPIDYFYYIFARDIGDKAMNIVFSLGELFILFLILKPPIFFQTNIFYIFLCILSTTLGIFLYFCFNLLLGFIAFWSPETWAPRFIFTILLNFFAGGLFPLDILPKGVFAIFKLLPFPYLLYFPLKVYLGQLSFTDMTSGIMISLLWVALLVFFVKQAWQRGLKVYTAYGR